MDFSPYEVVVQEDAYRIYWQDEARSVCVLQPLISHWQWDQALKAVETLDAVVRSVPHGVYVVYLFEIGRNMMPRGGGMIVNLQRLMRYYAPNVQMILFVRPDPSLRVFMDIVSKAMNVLGRSYHFSSSVEEAEAVIASHRQTMTASSAHS